MHQDQEGQTDCKICPSGAQSKQGAHRPTSLRISNSEVRSFASCAAPNTRRPSLLNGYRHPEALSGWHVEYHNWPVV
eukprot:7387456-Prymnesium_polylepis.7